MAKPNPKLIRTLKSLAPTSLTPGFIKSYGESSPGSSKLEGGRAPDHYSKNDLLSPMQVESGAEL